MLGDYEGTVIPISHDRDFLTCVVTSVDARRRRQMDRICRRLLGHAGATRRRPEAMRRRRRAAETAKDVYGVVSNAPKRKLNFNDKHALETLPKTIAKLQAEIAKQQRHLDDPNLYQKDRKKFDTASVALSAAQRELEAAEEKWLELEMLREEIEQA